MIMRRTRLPAKLTLQRVVSHRSRCVSTAQAPSSSLREHHGIKVAAATSAAMCVCVVRSHSQSAVDCQERHPNPVWPSGISEKDVNDFVDSVLTDSSINMSGIPDVVERSIYAATVTMTANLLYRAIAELHGIQLFGHELILKRQMSSTGKVVIDGDHFGIDEEILEQVADRLLMNSSVNQTLVPDVVERQLYINCLKLIFHMLDSIAYSLRITFAVMICVCILNRQETSGAQIFNHQGKFEGLTGSCEESSQPRRCLWRFSSAVASKPLWSGAGSSR
ncbi:hypothetical protein MHU86_23501 [Fragilaria crotonensis]|nr:hypothetical protein MHU86_23501 [Fragilaria crotonensis]